ncbi:MAG TPA: LCP family protein [Thermoanaerobaculia bacterium]
MTSPRDPVRFSRLDPEKFGRLATEPPKPEKATRVVEIVLFGVFAVLIVLAGVALYTSYSPDYQQVPNLVDQGMKDDRINVLLIGVGGDTHPGGGKDLADALLLVSLKPSTRQVSMISIPRDLYVKVGRFGKHRLNLAHSIGNESGYPGAGPGLLTDTVKEVFNQPVHAFARVDFAAFREIVDSLGGIEINVPVKMYDELFKDTFEAGPQIMSGDRALRYARYRYIKGPQGDNYARELRQQQVVDAIRKKLQNQGPEDVIRLAGTARALSRHTDTNLTTTQMISLYRTFKTTDRAQIRNVSLKPFMQYIRVRTPGEAGSAVRPWNGDYAPLHNLARNVFAEGEPNVQVATDKSASLQRANAVSN